MRGLGNKKLNIYSIHQRSVTSPNLYLIFQQKYKTNRFWCLKSARIYTEITSFLFTILDCFIEWKENIVFLLKL